MVKYGFGSAPALSARQPIGIARPEHNPDNLLASSTFGMSNLVDVRRQRHAQSIREGARHHVQEGHDHRRRRRRHRRRRHCRPGRVGQHVEPDRESDDQLDSHRQACTAHTKGKHDRRVRLGRALHGTWVTKDGKSTTYVTHDAIHGTVSAVSPTSISVKAADGVTETYKVTSATKVRMRTAGQKKGATSSIAQVKTGSHVVVVGTGTGTFTATHVVAGLKR